MSWMCTSTASRADDVQEQPGGIVVSIGQDFLVIQAYAENIIRVAYARNGRYFSHDSFAVLPKKALEPSPRRGDEAFFSTSQLQVRVTLTTGAVNFYDASGKVILAEMPGGRRLEEARVQGVQTFHARQTWQPNPDESLYGLGENQLELTDIKGYDLDLWQHNGSQAIPFLVSSRGYGILWDNSSYTRFGDLRPYEPMPAEVLLDADGKAGGLTASYFAGTNFERLTSTKTESVIDAQPPERVAAAPGTRPTTRRGGGQRNREGTSVRWEGSIEPKVAGPYIFRTYSNGGLKIWIDDKLVIDHWRQSWLPWFDVARVNFEAGHRYHIKIDWSRDQGTTLQVLWKTPASAEQTPATSLWSEVADGVDYYFVYGPRIDQVIGGYRKLTGQAPMMPAWAMGLWQSRQRYETQQQSLDVIDGFRSRKIPFDNIVQDWLYWPETAWGSHDFDPQRFPDPDGWIKSIHDLHAHVMLSVWAKFYPGTDNFKEMLAHDFLYHPNLDEHLIDFRGHPSTFYDVFNAEARKLFWAQMNAKLFSKHPDAWWLDSDEPDMTPQPTLDAVQSHMNPTAMGPGSRVLNAYPLMQCKAVYEGQQEAAPDQRVFILSRSGYAGQQRYASACWSGDTSSTWSALRKQVPAAISFSMSGVPYWTMDVGGFSVPSRFSSRNPSTADIEEWRELNTRWFEFGALCPLLRVHGEFPYREMWQYGGEKSPAYQAQLKFDRLRYRLLPYIYSLYGQVTQSGGTLMRGLVMDFPEDATAREITNQYLFGPALMVSPVVTYQARTRSVYLPQGTTWFDFWTGQSVSGGQTVNAPAPYDQIPLHVRAGSIIPFGPEVQYVGEKPANPITLVVYQGADGSFSLYQDDGLTYAYEKGAFAQIPLRWNDSAHTLSIGRREGSFPGVLAQQQFDIVLVSKDKPVGFTFDFKPDQTIRYNGEPVDVHLP